MPLLTQEEYKKNGKRKKKVGQVYISYSVCFEEGEVYFKTKNMHGFVDAFPSFYRYVTFKEYVKTSE